MITPDPDEITGLASKNVSEISHSQLRASLDSAIQYFLNTQLEDGSWDGYVDAGAQTTGIYFVAMAALGDIDQKELSGALHKFALQQLADGSFAPYPGADGGDLDATAIVYAGLHAAKVADDNTIKTKAFAWVEAHGGFGKCSMRAKIYLSVAKLFDPKLLSPQSALFKLVPGVDWYMSKKMALFNNIAANAFPVIIKNLISPGYYKHAHWFNVRYWIAKRIAAYLFVGQGPDGSMAAVFEVTVWFVLALSALGYDETDAQFQRALVSLNRFKRIGPLGFEAFPFSAKVWNTALVTRALLTQDPKGFESQIRKGLDALIGFQATIPQPRLWQNPPAGAPRVGGWAFEENNPYGSDPDSSSVVLHTLGLANKCFKDKKISDSLQRGLDWVLGMQNPDGGWPSFTWGQRSKPPGPIDYVNIPMPTNLLAAIKMALNPPVVVADPACEDETARMLLAFAHIQHECVEFASKRAKAFLVGQQTQVGNWWGRWESCYLPATAYIVTSLLALNDQQPIDSKIQIAVDWMISCQNSDGGWGETSQSYVDPNLAGKGKSNPVITGLVLTALMDAGLVKKPTVIRGLRYLLSTQNTDGSWQSTAAVGTVIPPMGLYQNPLYDTFTPTEALLRYLKG